MLNDVKKFRSARGVPERTAKLAKKADTQRRRVTEAKKRGHGDKNLVKKCETFFAGL